MSRDGLRFLQPPEDRHGSIAIAESNRIVKRKRGASKKDQVKEVAKTKTTKQRSERNELDIFTQKKKLTCKTNINVA